MKEAYVSFEIAKLLKEKGFDWETKCWYDNSGKLLHVAYFDDTVPPTKLYEVYPCPVQQMAMRWLREEKGIHISADIYMDSSEDADGKTVDEWTYWAWSFYFLPSGHLGYSEDFDAFDSYEEAVEAALKYVLKNLI